MGLLKLTFLNIRIINILIIRMVKRATSCWRLHLIAADPYFDIFLNPQLNMLHVKPINMCKSNMMMKEKTLEIMKVCAEWFSVFLST